MAKIQFHPPILLLAAYLSCGTLLCAQDSPASDAKSNSKAQGDLDAALAKVNVTLQADPKNVHAYVRRAAIYGQQKVLNLAQRDYESALALEPNSVLIKFDLAEIKFQQREFDEARAGFVPLQSDPELGDLVAYKIFLCDLMGNHDADAAKELDAFNKAGKNPSYYYANAAWDLSHNKVEEGRGWFNSASHIYSRAKNGLYAASLLELGHINAPVVSFTTKKGKSFANAQANLEDDGLRLLTPDGVVTVPLDQLPDDLSAFPEKLRKQIETARTPVNIGVTVPSFTTKQGQKYDNLEVTVESTGLSVHTATGWVAVPFDQLPDDLSSFPDSLRSQIMARRAPVSDIAAGTAIPSFTTKQGKTYNNVRVFVEAGDLRFQSGGEWVTVPFDQLPDDLSAFPDALEKQIAARRQPVSNVASGIKLPSLTTKDGKHYNNLSVFVEPGDLRCQTTDGAWVTIPFDQLPNDQSAFPVELQRQIAARQPAASK